MTARAALLFAPVRRAVAAALAVAASVTFAVSSDGVSLSVTKTATASPAIVLEWSGAVPPYQVFRSSLAPTVTDVANKIADTAATSYEDTPPAGTIFFYVVTAGCPAGTVSCGSGCVDVATDPAHCGDCGVSCGPGSCVAGACQNNEPLGSPCASLSECASGFCTDGFCCESGCGGVCETCSSPGREGLCDPDPAGQDPDGECGADPASTCDRTGQCSGARSCELYAPGTVCAAATCSTSTTSQLADACDGGGTCVDSGTQGCSPYACDSGPGTCRTTCSSNAHCAPGHACKSATGQCLLADGSSCVTSSQCLNNTCCTGICRNPFTDANNCGQCGRVCQLRNASSNVCSAGQCSPTCLPGYSNCDGNPANGCEQCFR